MVGASSPPQRQSANGQCKAEELELNEWEAEANAVDAVLGEKAMWYWQNASGQVLPVDVGNGETTAHWQVQKDPQVSHAVHLIWVGEQLEAGSNRMENSIGRSRGRGESVEVAKTPHNRTIRSSPRAAATRG